MSTGTLILSPRHGEDTQLLAAAARAAGWTLHRLQRWRLDGPPPEPPVAIYGEPLFVEVIADALGLELCRPDLDWLARLPEPHRRREVRFTSLGAARRLDRPRFIKPADDKAFAARVYPTGAELPHYPGLEDDLPVLVAEPVHFELEARCFVHGRALATASIYARDGALAQADDGTWPWGQDERDGALACVHALLADPAVALAPALVVDVGRIRGRGWAVVEANPAYGSGLYGCDPTAALTVIARACQRP